jgi:3-oxoadipate enol-lactonase
MPRIRLRDIDVYYEIHGSGPRLLYIGGSGGDLRQNPRVFDGPLVDQFEVLSYDQRGLGQTSTPPGPYTMGDYAEDAEALLDAVGWGDCLVMGVSFGGMVAQEFVCRFPDRVRRLVLACTSSGGQGGASYPLHELQELSEEDRFLRMIGISDLRNDKEWQAAHPDALTSLIEFSKRRVAVGADEPDRELGQRLQLEARKEHDTYDRLSDFDLPVYICAGCFDGIAPPDNQHELERSIPGARLDFFEGGHLFLIQDKTAFGKIAAFLLGD